MVQDPQGLQEVVESSADIAHVSPQLDSFDLDSPVSAAVAADATSYHFNAGGVVGGYTDGVPDITGGLGLLVKNMADRLLAFFGLLTVSPLLMVVALAIKLDSRGSVFFTQMRGGQNGESFRIYKFRTMREEAGEDDKADHARPGDDRTTKLGSFLRRSSIDELPQLINVLKGDMSLVGPRPHMVYHDEVYSSQVRGYKQRFRMKPGLTGWAQVKGFRGMINTNDDMQNRVDADNYYIDHWSLWLDVKILFKSVWVVLRAINAH